MALHSIFLFPRPPFESSGPTLFPYFDTRSRLTKEEPVRKMELQCLSSTDGQQPTMCCPPVRHLTTCPGRFNYIFFRIHNNFGLKILKKKTVNKIDGQQTTMCCHLTTCPARFWENVVLQASCKILRIGNKLYGWSEGNYVLPTCEPFYHMP